jgi:hypothetical protein
MVKTRFAGPHSSPPIRLLHKESQPIPRTQELSGQALRGTRVSRPSHRGGGKRCPRSPRGHGGRIGVLRNEGTEASLTVGSNGSRTRGSCSRPSWIGISGAYSVPTGTDRRRANVR